MARMRTIKPGFFTNEDLATMEPLAALLFAGLWCWADREGRLEDRPARLKLNIFPGRACDVDELLENLATAGLIVRYVAEGRRLIQIPKFTLHQNPHYKEPRSDLPPPPDHVDSGYATFGVSAEQRARVLERDGHKCVECGATEQLTIDHVVPRSKGGSGEDENVQTLCRAHNTAKGNRLAADARPTIGQSSVNRRPTNREASPAGHESWAMGHESWGAGLAAGAPPRARSGPRAGARASGRRESVKEQLERVLGPSE